MSRVFTASLLPSFGGKTSVAIRNLLGEDLCSLEVKAETVKDLELALLKPDGIAWRTLKISCFKFYVADQPSQQLDMQQQLASLGSELVIKQADVEVELRKSPNVGKFLEAMEDHKFDPASSNFDESWTAAAAPLVSLNKAFHLVEKVLREWPTDVNMECRFVRVFEKLTALGESHNWLNLRVLYGLFDFRLKPFKHAVSEHWLGLARSIATSMVSKEMPPVMLLVRRPQGEVCGVRVAGTSFPSNFADSLGDSLRFPNDVDPSLQWSSVGRPLVSLDWDPYREGEASFRDLYERAEREPPEFAMLQPHEVSQMVHVQLRLSCCGVAEVQGSINQLSVTILAQLLRYKLTILTFEKLDDQSAAVEGYRGTLVLVTGVPPCSQGAITPRRTRKRLRGKQPDPGPHRMILCYNTANTAV